MKRLLPLVLFALLAGAAAAASSAASPTTGPTAEQDAQTAKRIAMAAIERANAVRDRLGALAPRVSATRFPSVVSGRTDTLRLRSSAGRNDSGNRIGPWYLELAAAYCCGSIVRTNAPLVEYFVGRTNRPGGLGVRSRQPNGRPGSGAKLYARDAEDRYDLALNHVRQSKPTLDSESPFPLFVETAARADIVLSPGGGAEPVRPDSGFPQRRTVGGGEPVGEVVVLGPNPVVVNPQEGWISFPDLTSPPTGAPVGALARVDGQLRYRTASGWVAIAG